ncbi:MAG: hypothetical protein L6V91_00255 [Bacilli bacterium]|nr:MAG: hypothetical protein L6V91_00255 [Bacilli bacterium]
MKECRKCKKTNIKMFILIVLNVEHRTTSILKRAKVPDEVNVGTMSIVKKIWNIILYIFGGLLIVAYLTSITKKIQEKVFFCNFI